MSVVLTHKDILDSSLNEEQFLNENFSYESLENFFRKI